MDNRFVGLLILMALFSIASVCSAQSDEKGQAWLPPSWVWGSGYTPYDYAGGAYMNGYDPFFYGRTYNPYGNVFSYYSYQGKTYNPYSYYYWYPYSYYNYNWRYS